MPRRAALIRNRSTSCREVWSMRAEQRTGRVRETRGCSTSHTRQLRQNWRGGSSEIGRSRITIVWGPRNESDLKTRFTYRQSAVRRLPQAFTVAEHEQSVLIVLVNGALRLKLRVVACENTPGIRTGGRLEGFSLRVKSARVHGGRNQEGDWGWKGREFLGLYNQVTGRV